MLLETKREGRLLRLTLNRPEKRNALNLDLCRELAAGLNEANDDPSIGAVLLSGAGKAFCAGMDLTEAATADRDELATIHDRIFTIGDWLSKPLVAAVHGPALAGGTGLAANAHIVIASEDATFGLTEIRIGLWPVLIFPTIVLAVGERHAVELALTGRIFGAVEAERIGLVTEVASPDKLLERAAEIATELAGASFSAIRAGLGYVSDIRGRDRVTAMSTGRITRDQIMADPDFAEGLRSFREKTPPQWPSHS